MVPLPFHKGKERLLRNGVVTILIWNCDTSHLPARGKDKVGEVLEERPSVPVLSVIKMVSLPFHKGKGHTSILEL